MDHESNNKACNVAYTALNRIEELLKPYDDIYTFKNQMTESDTRTKRILIRFDTVYVQHFEVNIGTTCHNCPSTHRLSGES